MWKATTKAEIEKMIGYCEEILSLQEDSLKFWEYIKIKPEKWAEKQMGEQGGGFWVVALLGKKIMYYNDIEEGFNLSAYTRYGEIDEYLPGQMELHEMINSLYSEITRLRK
jgi:hypothetical protein